MVACILAGCRWAGAPNQTLKGNDFASLDDEIRQPADLDTSCPLFDEKTAPANFELVRHTDDTPAASVLDDPEPLAAPELIERPAPTLRQVGPFEVSELEQLANENNPSLARVSADIDALQGKWIQAGLPPNPTLGYVAEEIGDEGTAGKQGVYWSRPFIRGNKLSLSQEVVAREIQTSLQRLETQRLRVLTDVRIGYIDFLISLHRLKLAQQLVEIGGKAVADTDTLLRKGEVQRVELLRAEAEAATLNILVSNATHQRDAAWNRLAAVVGIPTLGMPEPDADYIKKQLDEAVICSVRRDSAIERLLNASPELSGVVANVERARWAVERAYAQAIPNVNLQVSLQFDAATNDTVTGVQMGMPIPIRNRNQGGIRAAQAELVSAELAVDQTRLALQRRFELVYQQFANAREQVKQYIKEDGILAKTEETLNLTTRGYEAEELSSLDMLTAQRIYTRANLSYLDSVRQLWVAETEIRGLLLKDSLEASL